MGLELDVKFDAVEEMVVVELLFKLEVAVGRLERAIAVAAPSASASVREWGIGSGGEGVGGCGGEDGGGYGMKYEDLES
nr:hypothetical protein HmN_000837200 [Hymenolepis microstoma]CUU98422.1 hypothetical transcript [Hymenolepis microstoma]